MYFVNFTYFSNWGDEIKLVEIKGRVYIYFPLPKYTKNSMTRIATTVFTGYKPPSV